MPPLAPNWTSPRSDQNRADAGPRRYRRRGLFSAADAETIAPRGNVAYVLHDQQVRVEAQGSVHYTHSALRALDGRGVELVAHVSVNFDPGYQRLTFHTLNLIRGGKVLGRLSNTRIQVLQRETELEYLIYDGSMTASAMLDDVRIGDIVEYAYSIAGSNLVFRNHAAGTLSLAWSVPLERAYTRLLMPAARSIGVTPHSTALQPVVTEADGYRDYRWDQRNVAGLPQENNTPDWHDPYGRVQWTEFADWAAVVQWALPLYLRPGDRRGQNLLARSHARTAGGRPGAPVSTRLRPGAGAGGRHHEAGRDGATGRRAAQARGGGIRPAWRLWQHRGIHRQQHLA